MTWHTGTESVEHNIAVFSRVPDHEHRSILMVNNNREPEQVPDASEQVIRIQYVSHADTLF